MSGCRTFDSDLARTGCAGVGWSRVLRVSARATAWIPNFPSGPVVARRLNAHDRTSLRAEGAAPTIDPSVREVKKKYVPFYFAVSSSYATPRTPASAVGGAFG